MENDKSILLITDRSTLKVIADPLRAQIFEALTTGAYTIRQISEKLNLAPSRLYYHFALLEKHGLIHVVETRKVVLKPMSLEEAVLEMEGNKARFLIYRDTASENVSLVYRLDDGNFAHIETNS